MKITSLCLFGFVALLLGLGPNLWQQDDKVEAKKRNRDARYSDPSEKNRPISGMDSGQTRRGIVDFIDEDGYDDARRTAEEKNAIRDRLAVEQSAKRKAVACEADAILFGKIKGGRGHVTTDDTNIYTVYTFVVSDVYRASQTSRVKPGDQLEVTAPGGPAKNSNGKSVAVEHPSFSWLSPDSDHLLALKYDTAADDYYVFDPMGIYTVWKDGRLIRGDAKNAFLSRRTRLAREPLSLEAVASEVRSVNCSQ